MTTLFLVCNDDGRPLRVIQTEEGTEPLAEGGDDGMNHDNILREQNPLDMGDVTLVLWSIE